MRPRLLLLFFGLVLLPNLRAQVPKGAALEGKLSEGTASRQACADQFAGTIGFANFQGQSNDTQPDTLFLCFDDRIDIVHNGDADLSGDPDPSSQPGITYAFYQCPPSVSGPNLNAVIGDACLLTNPPPPAGSDFWVAGGGTPAGDITFHNDGSLQTFFNGGAPLLLWFAPITIDDFSVLQYEADPNTGEAGPCVNANTAEAFAVVYLNEITATNRNVNAGLSGCRGSFLLQGGLPEWDGSVYDIRIELVTDTTIQGEVVNGPLTHGQTAVFDVPTPGVYRVIVSDAMGCRAATFFMDMSACVSVTFELPSATVQPGDQICLDVTNVEGFLDIQSVQVNIFWDDAVLQFDQVQNFNPNLQGLGPGNFNALDTVLVMTWNGPSGENLPDGDLLFQICFTAVGQVGDCSPLFFGEDPANFLVTEISNSNNDLLGFLGLAGTVCISNTTLFASLSQDSVRCHGEANGSFTAQIVGGQPPYEISWQNLTTGAPVQGPATVGGSTFTAGNLTAGTYAVTITDDPAQPMPNVLLDTVEVLQDPELTLLFNESPPLCNGDSGSIEVLLVLDSVLLNNTSGYTFQWSNGDTDALADSIPSGFYGVTVTNSKGCTVEGSTFLPQPPALDAGATFVTATCSGVADGGFTVNVSGGTPDGSGFYTLEFPTIGGGLVLQNNTYTNNALPPDDYPLLVTDANGCTRTFTLSVPAQKVLGINASLQPVQCTGDCNGSIFVTGTTTGGAPATPYQFSWTGNPAPPPANNTATTSTLNNLCAGQYTLTLQDQDGCQVDTTFALDDPPELTLDTLTLTPESCTPGGDGSITVGVSGGTGAYSYSWAPALTNDPNPNDSIALNLSAGTYALTVTDANNCTDTASFLVGNPLPPIILSLENDTVSCENSTDGTLTVTAAPGNAPITTITWSNGATGNTIINLLPGLYAVTIAAEDGCETVGTANVIAPEPLTLDSVLTQPPACPGLGGGQITVFVSGGTAPYFFDWSLDAFDGVGQNVAAGSVVTAGDYTVIVTDANNCTPLLVNVTLDDPPAIVADFSAIDSVSCPNTMTCDGGATVSAQYSDGSSGTFNITWESGETTSNSATSTAAQLCQGFQSVTIAETSGNFCFAIDSVFIPAPPPFEVDDNVQIENVSCFGLSDGSATLNPMGGTPPYSISWDNGAAGPTISDVPAGDYLAVITDANNCTFSHLVTIQEPEPLDLFLDNTTSQDVTCPGGSDGIIAVVAQGGNVDLGPETYLWSNGIAPPNSAIAQGLSAGTYSVTVIDPKGCTDSLEVTINVPPPITFTLSDFEPIRCFGENTFIAVESVSGGNNVVYQYSVNNGPLRPIGQLTPVFGGRHVITVVDAINGCTASDTVEIAEPAELQVILPAVVEIELGDSLTALDPEIIATTPIDSFIWSPADQLSCTDCKNPLVNAIESQQYTLTVVDVNGCSAQASVFVDVDKNRNVYIPNVFSPNDDGINDLFQIFTGRGVTGIRSMRVFDRWGNLVFEAQNLPPSPDGSPGWDGTFNGRDMDPAVFVYIIEVDFLDNTTLVFRGDVTLLR